MTPRNTILATALTSLLASQAALGLGLGGITQNSALNEPMDAEVEILGLGDLSELELLVGLGSKAEFELAGVEREFFLTQLRFKVDLSNSNRPVIRITSKQPIKEPYLDFLMEVQWPSGRLLREYTVLLDLPTFTDSPQVKSVEAASTSTQPRFRTRVERDSRSSGSVAAGSSRVGDSEYRVSSGDTLWGIARQIQPEGSSIHQAMSAIRQINPNAFINGDINLLKSGHVLRLPQGADIEAADTEEVLSQLVTDTSSYVAPVDEADEPTDMPLDATLSAEEPAGVVEPVEGRLKLSALSPDASDFEGSVAGGDNSGSVGGDVSQAELAIVEEELDRTRRENAELRERLGNLEQQIETMGRLVELNDPTLTALQNNTTDTDIAEIDVSDSAIVESSVQEIAEEVADSSEDIMSEATAPGLPSEAETDVQQVSEVQPESAVKPTSQGVTVAEEPTWKAWLDMLLYPLIGLLAIILAAFLFFRNRSGEEDEDPFEQPVDVATPDDDDEDDALSDTLTAEELAVAEEMGETITEDDLAGLELEDDEDVDPLGEADIYLSLGNYAQAEVLLQDALAEQPDDAELQLKLLEVYVASKSTEQFEEQYQQLEELGDADTIAQAQKLRAELFAEEGEDEASADTEDFVLDELEVETQASETEEDFADDEAEIITNDVAADLAALDDILGDNQKDDQSITEQQEEVLELDDSEEDSEEDSEQGSVEEPGETGQAAVEYTEEEPGTSDDLDFDLEFELDDTELESLSSDIDELDLGELDLELGDADIEPEAQLEAVDETDALAELDKLVIDEKPGAENVESEIMADQAAIEALDADIDADLSLLSGSDEYSTKLELAEAYLDMGDRDGAKEILDEVVAEGSDEQQEKARSLLDSL